MIWGHFWRYRGFDVGKKGIEYVSTTKYSREAYFNVIEYKLNMY